MTTKLKPEIYKQAAARILAGDNIYCCCAIDDVVDTMEAWDCADHRRVFCELFYPGESRFGCFWPDSLPENQKERVMALLLMAEIAKDYEG